MQIETEEVVATSIQTTQSARKHRQKTTTRQTGSRAAAVATRAGCLVSETSVKSGCRQTPPPCLDSDAVRATAKIVAWERTRQG